MKKSVPVFILALAFWLVAGTTIYGAEVSGHVRGPESPKSSRLTIIVYAEALDGRTLVRPGHFKMTQRDKAFVPNTLAIPVGSKVDFPNEDPFFHNVFTQSGPGRFNLGMYRPGEQKSHVFAEPAVYRMFCKIHPQMTAVILVLPSSFITGLDATGAYRLDLPPGRFRVTAWSERTEPATTEVTVSAGPVKLPDLVLSPHGAEELPRNNK